jgi:hypothetical protein
MLITFSSVERVSKEPEPNSGFFVVPMRRLRSQTRRLRTNAPQDPDPIGLTNGSRGSELAETPGMRRSSAHPEWHARAHVVAPADCKSAIQQIGNLRYDAGPRSTFLLPSGIMLALARRKPVLGTRAAVVHRRRGKK